MKSLARRIGIIDKFKVEIEISKTEFIKQIKKNLESNDHHFFGAPSFDKPYYEGKISNDNFELKRKSRFLDNRSGNIKTTGEFHQQNKNLIIIAEVNGYNFSLSLSFLLSIVFFCILFSLLVSGNTSVFNNITFDLLFLFVFFVLMIGIPFIFIRREVRKVKRDFLSDLNLIIGNNK